MPSRVRSFTSRIRSFLMGKAAFNKRGTRRAHLEQLEARRVMAVAILDDLSFHQREANISSLIRMPEGEGEPNPPQVFFYSPSIPGFVKNSNHSVLFVDDSDVVKLSVFSTSSWTHEIYFDGGDVGLTNSSENVDALSIRADGSLLVSTVGDFRVNGLSANGEDLLLFRPTSLGTHTAGTWEMYFDGSDVGLSSWEGLDGVSELPDGRLILSVGRQADGLVGTVAPEDLVSFTVSSTGNNTSGTWQRFFDGSDVHLGGPLENLDGVSVDADGTTLNLTTTSLFCVPDLIGFGRDIFTFEATQLGSQTQGGYQTPLTLNGSHRGLLFNSIDAIHVPSATAVNQPPIIAGITSPTILELAPYQLQLSATDPDTPPTQLVWSLVSGPVGSQLSTTTGQFTWTPTEAQGPGVFPVIVAVTDGTTTAQATFSISVTEVNQPPVIAPIANQTTDESTLLTVQISATDADLPAQTLTYALGQGAPASAAITSTGSFTWTPSEADGPGVFTVPVIVTDALGASATQSFTITVREVNQSPAIIAIPDQTIDSGILYEYQVLASDPDLPVNNLTFSLDTSPVGATINPLTGVVSWMPTAAGNESFLVRVTDNGSPAMSTTEAFSLTVQSVSGSIVVTEGAFVNERSFPIELGQTAGTRTLRFKLDTLFDRTDNATAIGDVFSVYIKNPLNPAQTLLDRGEPGTAIFSLTETGAIEMATGLVQFNGQFVTVNLTSLGALTSATVVVQLLSHDADSASRVTVSQITNTVDPEGVSSPFVPLQQVFSSVGSALNYEALTVSSNVSAQFENIRFDRASGLYTAELKLTSISNVGSSIAVSFPGLPAGVQLLNASGVNANGTPYLNLSPATPPGGLRPNYPTERVRLQFSVAPQTPFVLRPQIVVGLPNRAPSIAQIDPVTTKPGDALVIPINVTDMDGDSVTVSIRALNGMPTAVLRADNTLLITPRPNQIGTFPFTLIANDGALQTTRDVVITVVEDLVKTTRISGIVQNTNKEPLAGVPVQLGRHQSETAADGSFTIELPSFETPTEVFDIVVPTGDPQFDPFSTGDRTITLFRSGFDVTTGTSTSNPRLHTNLVSSFIDASAVYGSDDSRAASLRLFDGSGKLKTSVGNLLPINNSATFPTGTVENENNSLFDPTTLFAAGDVRANENAPLMAMHTLLLREHNRKADEIASANPTLTDEVIYQQSRRWVTAVMQQVTYNEFLPLLLGTDAIPAYSGYDPNANPSVSGLFSAAAFRFAHSILVPEFNRLDADNQPLPGGPLSIRNAFFNATAIKQDGIEPYLRGMSSQVLEEFDATVISELRNFLFGPPGSGGMDLVALNIQRGRDLGLPSYNRARQDFGLAPVTSFAQISSDVNVQNSLASVYPSVNDIDVWVGGLAEDHVADAMVGELFRAVMVDQFVRTRNADRFWFENSQFTASELASLRSQTMSDLIVRNTSISSLPANVFTTASSPGGFGAGGSAAATPPSEYRSMNGSGNNLADPSLGQTGTNLLTNYTLDYGDGISTPAGADRVSARKISSSVFAGPSGQANSLSATTLFAIWGQLLTHDTNLTPGGTDNALKIFGNLAPAGTESYPFVAEKLPLMFENPVNIGANNTIARPIYLPALNTADAVTINPNVDTTVTVPISVGDAPASVFVRAGTLQTRQGALFTGQLSITEVPASLTPASLPVGLIPDTVVTIQPGEMVFTQPAPLTLPNRANLPAGSELDLWSINPITGTFEIVGKGRVSADRSVIETIEGGIRNSSWHLFVIDALTIRFTDDFNLDEECEPCTVVHTANSVVEAHSGAVVENHELVTYSSLGETRGVQLVYNSLRADPRPIVHNSMDIEQTSGVFGGSISDVRLVSNLTIRGNGLTVETPGASVRGPLDAGNHFWSLAGGGNTALQSDLRSQPTGLYDYTMNSGFVLIDDGNIDRVTGVRATKTGQLLHVNSIDSPFGSGWELAGLKYLVESSEGHVLMVDGDGSELLFRLATDGQAYVSPPGEFSILEKTSSGTFRFTSKERTVSTFDSGNRLVSVSDRNGNQTSYAYSGGLLTSIIDPVGLATTFNYTAGRVSSIVDPANRTTQFEYDAAGNLTRVTDPDGTFRTWGYDDNHHIVSEVDQRGFLEQMQYDFAGRAKQATRKDGSVLRYSPVQTQGLYPPTVTTNPNTAPSANFGDTATSTFVDGNGVVTRVELNRAGQSTKRTDGVGGQGNVVHNNQLLPISMTDGRGFTSQYSYDTNGNLTSVVDAISAGGGTGGVSFGSPALLQSSVGQGFQVADLNSDGFPDVVDYAVHLNNGAGGFLEPISLEDPDSRFGGPKYIEIADMNGDGLLDIVASSGVESFGAEGGSIANSLAIWLANPDGTYTSIDAYPTRLLPGEEERHIPQPGFVVADFNNDSHPDVLLTQSWDQFGEGNYTGTLILYLNDGTGALQPPVLIYPAYNGDANLPPRFHDVEAADLNGDGYQDLVISNSREVGSLTGPSANVVTVMLGNGDGTFGPPINYDLGFDVNDIPYPGMEQAEVELADLNSDGNVDVVVASTNHGFATVLLGNGLGGFGAPNVFATVPADPSFFGELRFTAIEIADLNGDSVLDIALASFDNKQIFVYLGAGDGTFSAGTSYNYDTESRFFFDAPFTKVDGLFAVDFDNDGKVDLLTASSTGNDIAYLRGKGDGTFVSWDEYGIPEGDNVAPEQIETIDLDNDGVQEIVTRTFRSGAEVRFGLGNRQYSEPVLLGSGITVNGNSSTTRDLTIIDANDDGFKDVVLTFTSDTFVLTHRLFINIGNRTFAAPTTIDFNISAFRLGAGLASGDFNNDGIDDLIAPETGTLSGGEPRSLKVAIGDGNGNFTVTTIPLAFRPWKIVTADVNNDGNQDLMVSLLDISGLRVFLGDGLGGFTESQNVAAGDVASLRTADLNGDGFVDLVFMRDSTQTLELANAAYVLNDGTGQFGVVNFVEAVTDSRRQTDLLSVGDVNSDGVTDIVISNATHYHLIAGRSGGGFNTASSVRGGGFAPSIADMDNDGVADIVGARSGRILFGSPHNESAITIHHGVQAVEAAPRQFTYESDFNQMTSMIDELGRQTFFEIDPANGNTLSVTQVIGLLDSTSSETDDLVTRYSYTASGQVATVTDPLGRLTQFSYDTLGRNTQITLASGTANQGTLSFTYDASGNVLTATDPNLNVSSFAWDALNRRTSFTDAVLATANYVYDARGNMIESTDRAGSTIVYQYDALSRLIRTTDEQANVTVIGYDLFGNRTSVIDPLNQQSTYTYDGRNRMRTHTDPDGGVTQFIYDADNNLTRLIDPVGNLTQFVYDARGRQTREVDPLGAILKYDYDLVDNLVRKTDRNNRVTEFAYDAVDRLTSERWLNANSSVANTVNYSYDKASNLTALVDLFSSLAWTYDSRDRAITESNAGTPSAPVVQLAYAYDAASNVLSVNDTINGTAGAATSYLYDALNRMRRITQTDNGGLSVADKRVDIAYNSIGQFASINRYSDLAGSQLVVGTTYQFDSLNRLTRLAHNNSTTTVAFYDYVYDADSRISSITNIDGITNYNYDDRDQLTGANHADANNPDETYEYDANGNRLQSHLHNGGYVTGAANRLLSDGTFNYQYDAEGNRIRQTNIATGEYREFAYDHRNRLVAVVDFSAANVQQQRVDFNYDAIGRRISKTVDQAITHFVYDGEGVILDFLDADGLGGNAPVLSQRYLHGPAIDQVFAQESDVGDVSWLIADHLGTTRDLVDESGQLENHIKYDSFGNVIEQSNPSFETRYLFTGRELDAELSLYYYRSRFYDSATGRFLSEDTKRFIDGFNLQRYVLNNPLSYVDPYGTLPTGLPQPKPCSRCGEETTFGDHTDPTAESSDANAVFSEIPGSPCETPWKKKERELEEKENKATLTDAEKENLKQLHNAERTKSPRQDWQAEEQKRRDRENILNKIGPPPRIPDAPRLPAPTTP